MTWLDRVVVSMVALLLSLQLMASGHHKDQHVGFDDHCASCVFAHHVPSGLPEAELRPLPVTTAPSYRLERVAVHESPVYVSFLIPKSQAPPRG